MNVFHPFDPIVFCYIRMMMTQGTLIVNKTITFKIRFLYAFGIRKKCIGEQNIFILNIFESEVINVYD